MNSAQGANVHANVTLGAESHAQPEDNHGLLQLRGAPEQEKLTLAENIHKRAHFSRPLKRQEGDQPRGRAEPDTALVFQGRQRPLQDSPGMPLPPQALACAERAQDGGQGFIPASYGELLSSNFTKHRICLEEMIPQKRERKSEKLIIQKSP